MATQRLQGRRRNRSAARRRRAAPRKRSGSPNLDTRAPEPSPRSARSSRQWRERPQQPLDRPLGPTTLVGILLGMGTAMVIVGLRSCFEPLFAGSGGGWAPIVRAVVGVSMMALAVGVRVPQRFAMWLCLLAWRRFVLRGRPSDLSRRMVTDHEAERPLYWVVLSVVSLVAGVLIALTPLAMSLCQDFHTWMHLHFVWSAGPLAAFQILLVFATGMAPLIVLGLTATCAHHLCCRHGRWHTEATAWLLIGAAAGTLLSTGVLALGWHENLVMLAAALPILFVAVLSASSKAARSGTWSESAGSGRVPLPVRSDRWPRLLRTSIVVVSACGACLVGLWVGKLGDAGLGPEVVVAALLAAVGTGVLIGSRRPRVQLRSIGAFGLAAAVSGLVVGVGTVTLATAYNFGTGVQLMVAWIGMAAVGFAMAAGRQALLNQVANRSSTGAVMLARVLVFSALAVWIAVPVLERLTGVATAFTVTALLLLALGGTLILHEPEYSTGSRVIRIGALFASIAGLITLFRFVPTG